LLGLWLGMGLAAGVRSVLELDLVCGTGVRGVVGGEFGGVGNLYRRCIGENSDPWCHGRWCKVEGRVEVGRFGLVGGVGDRYGRWKGGMKC
jgi:hypothetical protein